MGEVTDELAALRPLWAARGVAVIGATDREGAIGRLPLDFLQRFSYAAELVPVRPDGGRVAGLESYPSVVAARAAGRQVDLAMIMVSAARVPGAVEDCIEAGLPVAIICSSGFAETGAEGTALQASVVARAREGGIRLLGPNCIGTVGVATGQVTSFSPLFSGERTELVAGPIGFVSQSGALGYGAVSLAFDRGLGLGWVVNTGNEADITSVEAMRAVAAEDGCRGILAYVESLSDLDGLRALTGTGVPVAILKAGRSDAGARAAASHTGALAAGDRVVDAALRQVGAVRVDDVDELLDVGDAMTCPRPKGRRVAIVTTSGGSGILAADALEARGLSLATLSDATAKALDEIVPAFGSSANPVDVTASVMSNGALFDRALDAIADDEGVDAIIACFCVLTGKDVDDVVASLARIAARSGKPVLVARTGADHLAPEASRRMREAGIPSYPTPARAVRALAALTTFATLPTSTNHPAPVVECPESPGTKAGLTEHSSGAEHLRPAADSTEAELKEILAAQGVPVPGGRFVTSADDARAAVEECGGRAVFKAVVPGLVHKSDAGGVIVGVTRDGAADAYGRVAALGGMVWVEEQVEGGVEALVGFAPSPLGTVLTVGVGGVLTEIVADVALRVLPISRHEIDDMLDESRLGRLLAGFRGEPAADREALADVVHRLCQVVADWPPGFELDLNPVTALPRGQGVRVLDAAYIAPKEST
jgi:acyl-CoA synthetase (NDP forming)